MVGVSFPPFFLGAVLLYFLGYKAGIFPLGGYVKFTDDPWQWFTHLILPWFTLSVLFIGFYSRVLRSTILDTINEDYVRTARAKGLSERQVLIRHVLRNSLIPIISLWGLDFAAGDRRRRDPHRDGLQPARRRPVRRRLDRPLDVIPLLVIVMLDAFFVVFLGAVVDILYALLDPRIRLDVSDGARSTLLDGRGPARVVRDRGRASSRPSTASRSRSTAARSWRSSASPAPASR